MLPWWPMLPLVPLVLPLQLLLVVRPGNSASDPCAQVAVGRNSLPLAKLAAANWSGPTGSTEGFWQTCAASSALPLALGAADSWRGMTCTRHQWLQLSRAVNEMAST